MPLASVKMYLPLTSEPNLRRLVTGDALTTLSDQLMLLAVPTVALLGLGMSASQASLLTAAEWLPALLLSGLVGRVVDRVNRKGVLLGAAALSILAALVILTAVYVLTRGRFELLFIACFLYSLGGLAFALSSTAMVPVVLENMTVDEAFASQSAARSIARVLGQAVSGPIVQFVSAISGVLLTAAISVFKALCVLRLKSTQVQVGLPKDERSFSPSMTVWKDVQCRKITAATFILNSGGATIFGVFFAYAYKVLNLTSLDVGIMLFIGGLSAIYSARRSARLMKRRPNAFLCAVSGIIAALSVWLIPLALFAFPLPVLVLYEAIFSAAATIFFISFAVLLQSMVPNKSLGQLLSVLSTLNAAAMVIGALGAALLADILGVVWTIVVGCCASSIGAICLIQLTYASPTSPPTGVVNSTPAKS